MLFLLLPLLLLYQCHANMIYTTHPGPQPIRVAFSGVQGLNSLIVALGSV